MPKTKIAVKEDRLNVLIPSILKEECQINAIKNKTSLKDYVISALQSYNQPSDNEQEKEEIEIN